MKNILIFLLLLPILCYSTEKADPMHRVKIGDTAPDFTLNFTDGKTMKLSDLKGKVVMLQFTASWCPVCIREMPFIEEEIWQKNKENQDFFLAAVDLKEGREKIDSLIRKTGITYPVLFDPDGKIFNLFALEDAGVTRNVIIDQNGKVAYLTRLFDREEFDGMKKKIKELLENGN